MKPKIFVSHIHEEANLAKAIKDEITTLLLGGVEFFVSSDRSSLSGGDRWLETIETKLNEARIVLVLCSKNSVLRPWVNFEAGAAWISAKGKKVIPLCHSDMQPGDLPPPLGSLIAYSLSESEDLVNLVALIAKEAELSPPNFEAADLANSLRKSLYEKSSRIDEEERQYVPVIEPLETKAILESWKEEFINDGFDREAYESISSSNEEELNNHQLKLVG
jgi:TIR domain